MDTPTLHALGVYWESQQLAIMLCKMVRSIGHFLSDMILIWSNGQADEPARAFFIIAATSAYEGGERSNGMAGGGSEMNQYGIWNKQPFRESGIERTLEK